MDINIIFQLLNKYLPIIIGSIVLLVIFLAYWLGSHSTRFKRIEKDLSNVAEKVEFLKEKSKCVAHSTAIDHLELILRDIQLYNARSNVFFEIREKRELSEMGERLFEESGCKEFLHKMRNLFVNKLEERKPLTPLDIETEAHNLFFLFSKGMSFNPIKNFIYNNPVYMNNYIDLNLICLIMGIKIRDLFLIKQKLTEVNEIAPGTQN